jgi:hypothetical protein
MLVRQLWKDPQLRRLCDIVAYEPPYGIAVLSRITFHVQLCLLTMLFRLKLRSICTDQAKPEA